MEIDIEKLDEVAIEMFGSEYGDCSEEEQQQIQEMAEDNEVSRQEYQAEMYAEQQMEDRFVERAQEIRHGSKSNF